MQTKREYAASLGLAIAGARGKFSRAAVEAIAKTEAEGMKFSDSTGPVKPALVGKPKADKPAKIVNDGVNSPYIQPSDFRFPESEYRAVGFVDGKRTVYGMRECCNTCRVSLVNHMCNTPSVHNNVAVTIEPR